MVEFDTFNFICRVTKFLYIFRHNTFYLIDFLWVPLVMATLQSSLSHKLLTTVLCFWKKKRLFPLCWRNYVYARFSDVPFFCFRDIFIKLSTFTIASSNTYSTEVMQTLTHITSLRHYQTILKNYLQCWWFSEDSGFLSVTFWVHYFAKIIRVKWRRYSSIRKVEKYNH